ncbi:hypothetical protein ERO13_D07G099200v2 [Gossypium hirsutum]|uniref:Uncharacterized protein n=3 Tax=Gossypium TaxID=3633 RepID=A0A1U8P1G5_GOSHI|nr:uncharacterized protein LOC107954089 [Gossypium hirsutum]KAG4137872.1 hypothetical protein ERO13_D07G099200v2 [Gossypium hirsutum]TYH62293.1 hypothetical protein ES332_D07G110600v1 [Gossypium tomentosum]TYI73121.1 hypothetical protein E1A91_D07G109200v1 [Gossypium mustelinum]
MAKTCISNCINDTRVPLPVRPTYVNLYKWPESDAEFVRSLSSDWRSNGGRAHPTVVDSISCRQIYLRSYTFHRNNQTETENTKCFGRSSVNKKEKAGKISPRRKNKSETVATKKCTALRKAKEVSCAALLAMFRRLLACTSKVDVADHHGD